MAAQRVSQGWMYQPTTLRAVLAVDGAVPFPLNASSLLTEQRRESAAAELNSIALSMKCKWFWLGP